jgi:small subunit ribosomal protein S6
MRFHRAAGSVALPNTTKQGVLGLSEQQVTYEGMFILDANRFARERTALPEEVEGLITAAGGEVVVSRLWEERRLAFAIKGQRKGAYWLIYFKLPPGKVGELTRACEIHDHILRQLFVRLPEALVEPIIEHAQGKSSAEPEGGAENNGSDDAPRSTPRDAVAAASS